MSGRLIAAALVVGAVAAPVRGQDSGLDASELSRIRELMRQHHVPGLSLALVRDGTVRVAALGMTDASTGAPVEPTTVFEAASLSKPVTAYLVLQAVAAGELSLGAPLTPLAHASPPVLRADEMTVAMALSHSTGLPNWTRGGPVTLRFAPGRGWGYSGQGYVTVQHMLEAATGRSLDELAWQRLLGPLGMTDSGFVWRDAWEGRAAMPHDDAGARMDKALLDAGVAARAGAASTLQATARDYARFLIRILAEARGEGELPEALALRMLQPQAEVDPGLGLAWGLGWALERLDDRTYAFHWGANPGFRSFALADPADAEALVVFTNGNQGLEMMDELVEALTGRRHPLFDFYMLHPND